MMRRIVLLGIFILGVQILSAQCIISCNSNVGVFSNDDPTTIAYDNLGSAFHSTYSIEEIGNRFWGEQMQSNGFSDLLNPQFINSSYYSALTGSVYHIGIGSSSINNVQFVVLTSTGLFVGGSVGSVIHNSVSSNQVFSKITVNGKSDGLPTGILPDSVKMMFVTQGSIIITTCGGRVFVLSIHPFIRGGKGAGSNTSWSQVMQSSGIPLTNVIAARGCAKVGYALKKDSTIWTWGEGILKGDGSGFFSSDSAIKMTLPAGVTGIKMIQATRMNTTNYVSYYLLGTNQRVYALGKNNFGQLGDRTTTDKLVWVNCKYPDNTDVANAAWISTNEHDPYYAALGIINKKAQVYTCGYNSTYMIGRNANGSINHLDIPSGISASDTILHCEVGGHTTAFIKIRSPRYGYVGHLVNGSVGNGSSNDGFLSSVDFITPPIISICGTQCDTPKVYKKPMSCNDSFSKFIIKNKQGNKVFYRLNNGNTDSVIIGAGDSAVITINFPTEDPTLHIVKLISNKYFCNLALSIRDTITYKGMYHFKSNQEICNGDSVLWRGFWRKASKLYSDTLKSRLGCDSIISLNVIVVDSFITRLYDTICKTKSKLFNGSYRTISGIYKDTLYSVKGCDSFIYLHLSVLDTIRKDSYVSICYYDSIQFNNKTLKLSGIYKDTLVGANGCDYFLYLHLKVNDSSTKKTYLNLCKGQTIFYNNQYLSKTGIYRDTLKNQFGCDSFDYLHLTISDTIRTIIFDTTCYNAPILFNGQMLSSTGIYKDTLMNEQNCDSFIYLHLTVQQALSTNLTINLCENQTYRFNGFDLGTSGIYYDTFRSYRGCDSFIILNLTVYPLPQIDAGTNQVRVNCEGDSIRLGTTNFIDVDYSWTPNVELDNAFSALPWCKTTSKRQYYLTAKNKTTGCISKDSVLIDIINSQLTATKTLQNLKCHNDSSGIITIQANNGYLPYTYSTNKITYQTNNVISNLKATKIGNYYVRDAKGCTYLDTFSLSQPDTIAILITKTRDLLCFNDSTGEIEINAIGGTPPYTYSWNKNNNFKNHIVKLKGGQYTVTVTDMNQCSNSKAIFVFEPNKLEPAKIDTVLNPCYNDSIAQIAISLKGGVYPYKYYWSNGDTIHKISKLKEGIYALTVSDKNKCLDTYYFDLKDPTLLKIDTIYRTKLNCEDFATIDIRSSGGTPFYSYSSDSGFTYSRLRKKIVYKIGKYDIVVMDKNYCKTDKTIQIEGVELLKIDVIPEDTLVRINEPVLLNFKVIKGDSSRIESLRWSPSEGLSCSDCPNPMVNSYISENYTLEARYNENCITTDRVRVNYKDEIFYIPNAFTPASQDPNNNQIRIYSNNVLRAKLSIFNRWGEKVFESNEAHRIGWNGIYKGIAAPMAVYVYYAEIVYLNGRKIFTSGDITLIR